MKEFVIILSCISIISGISVEAVQKSVGLPALKCKLHCSYSLLSFSIDCTITCSLGESENNAGTMYNVKYGHTNWHSKIMPNPIHGKNFETLKLSVTGTNQLGSNEQIFLVNPFEHTFLGMPRDLRLLAKNSTSITLQWNIGDYQYFPKRIAYNIQYKHSYGEWNTFLCTDENVMRDGPLITCTISDLFPNTEYQFQVFMQSLLASHDNTENYTSEHEPQVSIVTDTKDESNILITRTSSIQTRLEAKSVIDYIRKFETFQSQSKANRF